jgi:hypothetical protein
LKAPNLERDVFLLRLRDLQQLGQRDALIVVDADLLAADIGDPGISPFDLGAGGGEVLRGISVSPTCARARLRTEAQ